MSIGDVGAEVNSVIDQIAKLGTTCGKLESQVHNFVSSGQGYWASNSFAISRADEDSDLDAHNKDRQYLCKHLAGALYERFSSLLSDSVVQAVSALLKSQVVAGRRPREVKAGLLAAGRARRAPDLGDHRELPEVLR